MNMCKVRTNNTAKSSSRLLQDSRSIQREVDPGAVLDNQGELCKIYTRRDRSNLIQHRTKYSSARTGTPSHLRKIERGGYVKKAQNKVMWRRQGTER